MIGVSQYIRNPLSENHQIFMSNIPPKIKKNIEKIELLKEKIINWQTLNHHDLLLSIKEFEKGPRQEVSVYYEKLFHDPQFAVTLLEIYKTQQSDSGLTVLIISAIGNMMRRYHLPETNEIYELMLNNLHKPQVGPYVAIFLPAMKLFTNYDRKWDYFMKVKDMTPRKIAESSFETIIDSHKDSIPDNYKDEIAAYFNKKAEKANNEYGKQYYLNLIKEILA